MPRWVKDATGKNVNGGRAGKKPAAPQAPKLKTQFDIIGDWENALGDLKSLKLDDAIERAVRQEAALAEKVVKQNLTRGGAPTDAPFARLSPWTLAARRLAKPAIKGTKPLIARGDMRNAVTHVVEGNGRETTAFVGVLKQAIGGKPGSPHMVNVAAVQEFGKTIVVRLTPKMIRFLAVLAKEAKMPPKAKSGSKATKHFLVIRIPPRPFLRPAFETWSKGAPERFMKRVAHFTGGALGK